MIFHILANQITTLFLGINLLTTLTFQGEIKSYMYGGSQQDVFFQVTNDNKTLVLKPVTNGTLSNLLVLTTTGKYYFKLDISNSSPHQFVEVKEGSINHAFKTVVDTKAFKISEGATSTRFINKLPYPIEVNGLKIERSGFLSKGVPLMINNQRTLN